MPAEMKELPTSAPVLYQEYTTLHVLVMEYIEGYRLDENEALIDNGYDLKEIGSKLVDNYIKQVMDDGFSMRILIRAM